MIACDEQRAASPETNTPNRGEAERRRGLAEASACSMGGLGGACGLRLGLRCDLRPAGAAAAVGAVAAGKQA